MIQILHVEKNLIGFIYFYEKLYNIFQTLFSFNSIKNFHSTIN